MVEIFCRDSCSALMPLYGSTVGSANVTCLLFRPVKIASEVYTDGSGSLGFLNTTGSLGFLNTKLFLTGQQDSLFLVCGSELTDQ